MIAYQSKSVGGDTHTQSIKRFGASSGAELSALRLCMEAGPGSHETHAARVLPALRWRQVGICVVILRSCE